MCFPEAAMVLASPPLNGSAHLGKLTSAFRIGTPYALIIDDDPAIISTLLFILEAEGYAGIGFSDSRSAVSFLHQISHGIDWTTPLPALIILDLTMPFISGDEIATWLHSHSCFAHIPLLVLTANYGVSSDDIEPVCGAVACLKKPFQLNILLDWLARYL
jgi:CheY-like chemotaxis protein